MHVLAIVKGRKIDIPSHYCDNIGVSGSIDLIMFVDQKFRRKIVYIEAKRRIEFYGDNLELIAKVRDLVVISGNIEKYHVYDKHHLSVIGILAENFFN